MVRKILFTSLIVIIIVFFAGIVYFNRKQPADIETMNAHIVLESVQVQAENSGKINDIKVKQSARVKKGQVIAEIAVPQAPVKQISRSVKNISKAEEDYENAAIMYKDGIITQEEYDKELNDYKKIKNTAAAQSEQVKEVPPQIVKIYAPIDGFVVLNNLKNGDKITKDGIIAKINSSHKEVAAYFSPAHADSVKNGTPVDIFIIKYPERHFNGRIKTVNAQEKSGIPVLIEFTDSPDSLDLQNGDTAIVKIKQKK